MRAKEQMADDPPLPPIADDQLPTPTKPDIPPWGIALIVMGCLVIVVLAAVLPLVLIKGPKPSTHTSVTPSASPYIDVFPAVDASSILFDTALPTLDGLGKAVARINANNSTAFGIMLTGQGAKSGQYYVSTTGTVAGPTTVPLPDTDTVWASTTSGSGTLIQTKIDLESVITYEACTVDLPDESITCAAQTWASSTTTIGNQFYNVEWLDQQCLVTVISSGAMSTIYVQSSSTVYTALTVALTEPALSIRVASSGAQLLVIAFNGQNVYSYLCVNTTTAPTVQTITIDASNVVLDATPSYDCSSALVLTMSQLQLYQRVDNLTLEDVVNFNSDLVPVQLGVGQQSLWCVVGSTSSSLIFVPYTSSKFTKAQGRSYVTSLTAVNGPVAIDVLSPGTTVDIVATYNGGTYRVTGINLATM